MSVTVDLSYPLQYKWISEMLADAELTVLVGQRVYDYVPGTPAYPYVRYGLPIIGPWRPNGEEEGNTIQVTLHVFDHGPGRKRASQVGQRLVALFNNKEFDLSAGRMTSCEWTQSQFTGTDDNQLQHLVVLFETVAVTP